MIKRTFAFILIFILILTLNAQSIFAQDTGRPAMQSVALFTIGGAGGGAVLGAAYWMMDPLNPNADLRESAMIGLGIGAIAGFIFGVNQLYKQAIIPGYRTLPPDEIIQGMKDRQNDPTLYPMADRSFGRVVKAPVFAFQF